MIANLTHYDLDGVVSNILMEKAMKLITYKCGYDKVDWMIDKIIRERTAHGFKVLFATDMVLTQEQLEKLEKYLDVVVLDHHESSLKLKSTKDTTKLVINTEQCGASLVWSFISKNFPKSLENDNNNLKDLAYMACTYDLWKKDSKSFNEAFILNEIFWIYQWDTFKTIYSRGYFKPQQGIIDEAMMKINRRKEDIKKSKQVEISKDSILVVADEVYKFIGDMSLTITDKKLLFAYDTKYNKVSIRALKLDCDIVEAMEELFEGNDEIKSYGGHKHAAGFVLNDCADITKKSMDYIEKICNILE